MQMMNQQKMIIFSLQCHHKLHNNYIVKNIMIYHL